MNTTYPAALPAIEQIEVDQLHTDLSLQENANAMRFEVWWLNEGAKLRNESPLVLAKAAYDNATVNADTPIVIEKKLPTAGMFALYAFGVVCGIAVSLVTALFVVQPN